MTENQKSPMANFKNSLYYSFYHYYKGNTTQNNKIRILKSTISIIRSETLVSIVDKNLQKSFLSIETITY